MKRFYVYMLLCADNTFYVGVTNDLERRVAQHEYGNDPESYTFSRRPLQLVHSSDFQSVLDAINWEKRLKSWSHSKKWRWCKTIGSGYTNWLDARTLPLRC